MKDLERLPHNNTKSSENINRMKPRQSLLIQGESSLTVNPTEQAKIVAEHFRSTFFKKTPNQCIPMRVPFTTIKTCRAVNKMKTNTKVPATMKYL